MARSEARPQASKTKKSQGTSSGKSGWILLGDQLFPESILKVIGQDPVLMVEDFGLCTHFKYHQQKIVLFLAAMRTFCAEHSDQLKVTYFQLQGARDPGYFQRLEEFVKSNGLEELHGFEIADRFFEQQVQEFCDQRQLLWVAHPSPGFLTARAEFQSYLVSVKKPFMKSFYERQRKRLNLLMDSKGRPQGGQFSFDVDNRHPYRGEVPAPGWPPVTHSEITKDVILLVSKLFSEHPGRASDFCWPVRRKEALAWYRQFLRHGLEHFGQYEDAIHSQHEALFHSLLSPMINMGLLLPSEVVEGVVKAYSDKKAPLNSVEGFVRQMIGWREFVFGVDRHFGEKQDTSNFFGHQRLMASTWREGATGVPLLDRTIARVQSRGWCHHIERLMILSNLMLLSELNPREVHRWFMEHFVDSADWVMGPNVYGMGQFSDGGVFATKPYICGSAYLLKMSDEGKGPWMDEVDGLYWRFIDQKRGFLSKNPRLKMMVSMYDKMKSDRKEHIARAAEAFLRRNTRAP